MHRWLTIFYKMWSIQQSMEYTVSHNAMHLRFRMLDVIWATHFISFVDSLNLKHSDEHWIKKLNNLYDNANYEVMWQQVRIWPFLMFLLHVHILISKCRPYTIYNNMFAYILCRYCTYIFDLEHVWSLKFDFMYTYVSLSIYININTRWLDLHV